MKPTDSEIKKAKNLDDIADLVSKCTRCPLYKEAKNPVPGEGNPKSEIMFIGEGPGEKEDLLGRPFVGAAGKFLEEMLGTLDLKREDVFIANIVKHRPPQNRDPLPQEKEACLPFLLRQIEIIKPVLICFLGRHSMEQFLPDLKISQVHGQPKRYQNQVYLPLYHPAAALYHASMKQELIQDFKKIPLVLKKISET